MSLLIWKFHRPYQKHTRNCWLKHCRTPVVEFFLSRVSGQKSRTLFKMKLFSGCFHAFHQQVNELEGKTLTVFCESLLLKLDA